jgi:hypothetical protein
MGSSSCGPRVVECTAAMAPSSPLLASPDGTAAFFSCGPLPRSSPGAAPCGEAAASLVRFRLPLPTPPIGARQGSCDSLRGTSEA